MARPVLRVDPAAAEEAAGARQWYERRSASAAAAFVAELDIAIESILEAPLRWPEYMHGTRRFVCRRFPYFLVYRASPDEVQLIAVVHARRRPGYWSE